MMDIIAQVTIQTAANQGFWFLVLIGQIGAIGGLMWTAIELWMHKNYGSVGVIIVVMLVIAFGPVFVQKMMNAATGANITLSAQPID